MSLILAMTYGFTTLCLLLGLLAPAVGSYRSVKSCTRPSVTSISYRGDGAGELPEIYEALVTCPNITTLELDLVEEGCVVSGGPWTFDFRDGDRFPPLKRLSLLGFDFEDGRSSNARFHNRNSKPAVSPLKRWQQAIDWRHVESLEIDENAFFFGRMGNALPALRNLTVHLTANMFEEARGFLSLVPSLEALHLHVRAPNRFDKPVRNRTDLPLGIIRLWHRDTLRSLHLHQAESELLEHRRLTFNANQIHAIGDSLPNLTDLGLDLDRNGSWPNATLNALITIPQLRTLSSGLEIGLDLHQGEQGEYDWNEQGLSGVGPFREPRVSLEVVEELFQDLRAAKVGRELLQLNVTVGDYSEESYSGPLYIPDWAEGRARIFVCDAMGVNKDGKRPLCFDRDAWRRGSKRSNKAHHVKDEL